MPDLSAAPQSVQKLSEWLAGRGTALHECSFDSASNQTLQAHTPRGTVQVLADRGQWFVELAPPRTIEFFDMATWISCLTGTEVSLALESLDVQVGWIEEYLVADAHDDVSVECLRQARRQRAHGRMGIKW